MSPSPKDFPEPTEIESAAAAWTLRMDRGLTAEEQDEYTQWLAADPRHREAIVYYRWGWDEFDRLAGLQLSQNRRIDPDLLVPEPQVPGKRSRLKIWMTLAPIAAAAAFALFIQWPVLRPPAPLRTESASSHPFARIEQRTLEDGSKISLNRGTLLDVEFTPSARRVRLLRGEANFEVSKDARRPFIVAVAGIDVRAVGTAFNVRLAEDAVDVIVSEGRVRVAGDRLDAEPESGGAAAPLLEPGQQATVKLSGNQNKLLIKSLSDSELSDALLWQPRLLDFDAAPIAEIVTAFNQCNAVQLVIDDPELESMQLSSSFWSDNVESFVRLMESSFRLESEWVGDREILLRKSKSAAPAGRSDARIR